MKPARLPSALLALFLSTVSVPLPAQVESPGTGPGRTLEAFLEAALEFSPTLSIARERWNIGSARKDQVGGRLLPQVNASANVSDNTQTTGLNPESAFTGERYSLQVSQVLFNWQAFAARSQASFIEDQSEAEYYAQLAELMTVVADRYLAVLQAEDALQSVDSQLEAMTNQVNQIEMLYNLQQVQVTDLYEGQARLAATQAERVVAESELALAREGLRAASGLDVGDLFRLPENIDVPELEGSLADWLDRARNNNQLIEARTYALRAAEKDVSARRGAYLPQVSLVLQRQQSNVGFENLQLPNRTESNYVGVNVSVPLFAGGSNRAVVREAISQRNIADDQLRQVQLETIERTRTAWLQMRSGESRIEAGRVLAQSTDTAYTAMQRAFELNAVTTVDVLNALRDRFQAQRDLQQARYDHIRAILMLKREAGVLTAADILEVSRMLNEPFTGSEVFQ